MLTFIKELEPKIRVNGNKRRFALYKCDCGNDHIADMSAVKSGASSRCPECAKKQRAVSRTRHGKSEHCLYRKWHDMKKRCYNPNVERYKNYGGRGIRVCDEWLKSFQSFYDWCVLNNWSDNLQIDRLDVDGDYSPDNCRIISKIENGFNKTNTFYVTIGDVKIGLSELLYRNGLSKKYSVVWHGIKTGKRPIEYYIKKLGITLPSHLSNG